MTIIIIVLVHFGFEGAFSRMWRPNRGLRHLQRKIVQKPLLKKTTKKPVPKLNSSNFFFVLLLRVVVGHFFCANVAAHDLIITETIQENGETCSQ